MSRAAWLPMLLGVLPLLAAAEPVPPTGDARSAAIGTWTDGDIVLLPDALWLLPVDSEQAVDERRKLAKMPGVAGAYGFLGLPIRFAPGPR